jgi:hypothetical protein
MNTNEQIAELMKLAFNLREARVYDWDVSEVTNTQKAIEAHARKMVEGEPVADVTIDHFRGSPGMENRSFDYYGNLPPGTHKLYAAPQPAPAPQADQREVLQMALNALNAIYISPRAKHLASYEHVGILNTITALRHALAEPETP